jgi:glycosyltransferase involved in cell wall biosynthesis
MISVVIPVHNREQLIARSIDSVMAQTLAADEIIVVDDASTDRTADVVSNAAKSYSNLRLVLLKENVGASRARNVAVGIAKGDLIAFLDSDDIWHTDKLSKQVKEFNADRHLVAVFCGIEAVSADTGARIKITPKPRVTLDDLYHSNSLMTMSCALIAKSALVAVAGFDETLPTCEDWDLFIRLAEIGNIAVVQEALVEQMMHRGHRLSRDRLRVLTGFKALFEKTYRRISDPRLKRKVRASHEMRMADIFSTDYCFEPFRAIKHCCASLALSPSREALHDFRRVIKSSIENALSRRN